MLRRYSRATTFVILASAFVFTTYAWLSIWQHQHLLTHGHDLGIFDQGIWKLSQFQEPFLTVRKIPVHFFGDHFHPILLLLVPLYWLFHSVNVLLITQALLFSATIPLIYLLSKKLGLHSWAGVGLGLLTATHLGIRKALQFDFHELAFAVPLFMLIFLLIEHKKWKWYWVVLGLFMLSKESMPLYAALIGVTLLLRRQWKIGAMTMVISLVAFFTITRLIIPQLADGLGFAYWDQYKHLAASPGNMIVDMLQHPIKYLSEIVNHPDKRETLGWMLRSFAFLPLGAVSMLPLVFATMAERFWTNNPLLWQMEFHYQLNMVAIFSVASVYALRSIQQKFPLTKKYIIFIVIVMLGASLTTHYHYSGFRRVTDQNIHQPASANWKSALKSIPPDAAVSAQDAFVPHLTHRQVIYQFPRVRQAEYIVLDPTISSWPMTSEEIVDWQSTLAHHPDWVIVKQSGTLQVFHRWRTTAALPTVAGWE